MIVPLWVSPKYRRLCNCLRSSASREIFFFEPFPFQIKMVMKKRAAAAVLAGALVHVLITTDTLSGVWTYTRELVTGLVSRGTRVTLVSFGEIPVPEQTSWMESLHGLEYRPTAFRLDWMQEGQEDFKDSSAYLVALVNERKPDLLHFNHLAYGGLPVNVPRIVVAHGDLINWWRAVHGHEPKDSPWLRWYRQTLNEGLVQADAVVAPTVWMMDSMRSCYTLPRRNSVIYNGRNPVAFNPYGKKDDSVLAIGRLCDPGKQLGLLTQRKHQIPISIVVWDTTLHAPKFPIRADVKLSIDEAAVSLKGQQSEAQLRALYSRSSIYVATSRYEPFGTAAVEAALSRCVLVANDIPSFRETWEDAALYFRSNDASSLASVIQRLSGDRELCRVYANRAFQRAHECFTAKRMIDEYVDLYGRLLRNETRAMAA
jgi:glycogen(starch) synthase